MRVNAGCVLLRLDPAIGIGAQPAADPDQLPVPAGRARVVVIVRVLQVGLRRVPGNDRAWARLGAADVQQAQLHADPRLYTGARPGLTNA